MNLAPQATLGVYASTLAVMAWASAAEAAFLRVNDVRVAHRAEQGDAAAALLARHLEDRPPLLSVFLLIGKFTTVLLALVALRLTAYVGEDWTRQALVLASFGVFTLLVGQRIPASLGARWADRLAPSLLWPLRHLERAPFSWVTGLTGRALRMPTQGVEPGFKVDELRLLLEESEKQGVLDAQSSRMLQAILSLGEIPVRAAMLSLEDTIMVPETASLAKAAEVAGETGFSRLPLHGAEREAVTGYAHSRDLLVQAERQPEAEVLQIRQEILRLPPDASLVTALRSFRSSRYHMACVEAEGKALGILTIEDVLERIVGDIEDEHDRSIGSIQEAGEGTWWTDPLLDLDELAAVTGLEVPPGEHRTLGGFLVSELAAPPTPGDSLEVGEYTLTVDEADELMVRRIRVTRRSADSTEAEA